MDETGFRAAMNEHRIASGGGKAMGRMGGEDAEFFAGTRIKSNFICGLGYSSGENLQPRAPRLEFDEAARFA